LSKKVIIWASAYNDGDALRRTIDSILGQSYANFEYIAIDNAPGTELFSDIIGRISGMEYDFLAQIDAGDEYSPGFLETMLEFIDAHSLDIACCGSDFADAAGNLVGRRVLRKKLIVDNSAAIGGKLPVYYQYVRPFCGKLFSARAINSLNLKALRATDLGNGADTLFSLAAFQNAGSFGIIDAVLHRYCMYPKPAHRAYHPKRPLADRVLYDAARDFLAAKAGGVSPRNGEFLHIVYMNAVRDTLDILLRAEIPESEKIAGVIDIFSHDHMKQLAARPILGLHIGDASGQTRRRRELFSTAARWLLSHKDIPDDCIFPRIPL
jgi:glycosyltransferase involved in cell wall biosynthesis